MQPPQKAVGATYTTQYLVGCYLVEYSDETTAWWLALLLCSIHHNHVHLCEGCMELFKGEMIEPGPYIIADQFLYCQTNVLDQTISQSRDDNILVHIS